MKSIPELMESVRKAIPAAKFRLDEPDNPEGEWFLDIDYPALPDSPYRPLVDRYLPAGAGTFTPRVRRRHTDPLQPTGDRIASSGVTSPAPIRSR